MNATKIKLCFIGLLCVVSGGVSIQAAQRATPAQVESCRSELDDSRRLQCYDRTFGGPRPSPTEPGVPTDSTPNAPMEVTSATRQRPSKSFTAKIVEIRYLRNGAFVATLDNGQMWAQFVAEGKPRMGVGATVTIWPALLGSYNLKGPFDWITRVRPFADAEPVH